MLTIPVFHHHPALVYFRVFGMLVLLVMLLVAFIPTSSIVRTHISTIPPIQNTIADRLTQNWVVAVIHAYDRQDYPSGYDGHVYGRNFAMPLHCFWISPFDGTGDQARTRPGWTRINPDAPFTYLILLFSYAWKISSLLRERPRSTEERDHVMKTNTFASAQHAVDIPWFKHKVSAWLLQRAKVIAQEASEAEPRRSLSQAVRSRTRLLANSFRLRSTLMTYAATLAIYDFASSFIVSIWALTGLLIWGTLEIADVRNRSKTAPDVHKDESRWGFGQVSGP